MATQEMKADDKQNRQSEGKEASRGSQQGTLARRASYPIGLITPMDFFRMNPFSLMRRMTEEMDRVFGGGGLTPESAGDVLWSPAIEVTEREGNYVVRAELPGLKPEDVKVECTDDALVIEGERKIEREEDGGRRSERMYGRFSRVIPLPEGAKVTDAQARFQDGVLEVTIPVAKRDEKRRQIPIESGASANSAQQQGK